MFFPLPGQIWDKRSFKRSCTRASMQSQADLEVTDSVPGGTERCRVWLRQDNCIAFAECAVFVTPSNCMRSITGYTDSYRVTNDMLAVSNRENRMAVCVFGANCAQEMYALRDSTISRRYRLSHQCAPMSLSVQFRTNANQKRTVPRECSLIPIH
jgi:hypothetical protein